jgi:hypothetical protein
MADGTLPSAEGIPPLRSAQALRRFGRDESLYVQLYAYNARRDEAGKSDLVCQPEVLRGGAVVATGAPEPMADAADPVPHVSRIRLQRFDPGEYELRVTVTDRNATALAARSVRFTVD